MSAKIELSNDTHSFSSIASILSDYIPTTTATLLSFQRLFGGYSGRSYRVELNDGRTYVVKTVDGYSYQQAEMMCRTAYRLVEAGFKDCCAPVPKTVSTNTFTTDGENQHQEEDDDNNDEFRFVSLREEKGVPAFLLNYATGQPADVVLRNHPHLGLKIMEEIGGGLARLHVLASGITAREAPTLGLRWYKTDGGCCDVTDQVNGRVLRSIERCDDVRRRNEFLDGCYLRELEALRREMGLADSPIDSNGNTATATTKQEFLELGITHGDPFSDNVLVDPQTGALSSFVDIEDVCVGPLLFDLCCCAIGCCFRAELTATTIKTALDGTEDAPAPSSSTSTLFPPQTLDMESLASLLNGYCQHRTLPKIEREHFVPFLRLTLLCNCSWRFVKFNVGSQDVPQAAKESYRELQLRIEHLHKPEVVDRIQSLFEKYL